MKRRRPPAAPSSLDLSSRSQTEWGICYLPDRGPRRRVDPVTQLTSGRPPTLAPGACAETSVSWGTAPDFLRNLFARQRWKDSSRDDLDG
jgi:hypothetical protein